MSDDVNYMRRDLKDILPVYTLIEDCIYNRLKSKGDLYLPRPDPTNKSKENLDRYEAYKQRAIPYNATARTLNGFNGQVFMREPTVKLPESMKYLIENVDGSIGLNQFAQKLNFQVLALGRSGLFVDYPSSDKTLTKAEAIKKNMRPFIVRYHPANIRNYKEKYIGAVKVLSMVVLDEYYEKEAEEKKDFEPSFGEQRRVLYLNKDNIVQIKIYRKKESEKDFLEIPKTYSPVDSGFKLFQTFTPKNVNGEYLTKIPFQFIGSCDNDPEIDEPPMHPIAILQVGHYINSADYEESCHIVGQPTIVMTGLTEEWLKVTLKNTIHVGSRAAIPLPEGADAKMLQAEPNIMPKDAMLHKENQMVAMGAKLIQPSIVQKTATEAGIEKSAENSIVSNVAKNVSMAIEDSLRICAWYMGENDPSSIAYQIQTDFDIMTMSAEDRRQMVEEFQAGLLTFDESRTAYRKAGLASDDDEKALNEYNKKKQKDNSNGKEDTANQY